MAEMKGIEFEIKGSTDKATDGLKKLRDAITSLKSVTTGGIGLQHISDEIKTFSKIVERFSGDKIKAFSSAVKEIGKIRVGTGLTNSLNKMTTAIENIDVAKLNAITNAFKAMSGDEKANFSVTGLSSFTKFIEAIDGKSDAIWEVAEYLNAISQLDFSNLAEAAKNISDIAQAKNALDKTNASAEQGFNENAINPEIGEKAEESGAKAATASKGFGELAAMFDEVSSATKSVVAALSSVVRAVGTVLSAVKDAIVSFASLVAKVDMSVVRGFSSLKQIVALPFKSAAENAKNFVQKLASVGAAFKRILFYRAIRTLIKEIGDAFKYGVNNLYQWSSAVGGEFAASMNSIATSFAYFKNSVGAAVAPLINALAPAIDYVIDKAVTLLNVINQLFAKLSGATYWTRATRQATSYGDAAGAAGGAAKEALKYLAPFDELNVLPDNSSSGGGGGGGGAGSGLFEEVVQFDDTLESLWDLFNEERFYEAGELLAERFGEIIDTLDAKVNSEAFRSKILDTLSNITEIINGFFAGVTFSEDSAQSIAERAGDLLGDAIGLFLESLDTWYTGVEWSQIGVALAQFINGGIESLKEQPLNFGDVLADWINSKLDLISGTVFTVKWTEIGDWIADNINSAISGIDWSTAGATLIQAITGLADVIISAVNGLDADTIGQAIKDFLESAISKAQEWLTETPFTNLGQKVGSLITSAVTNINDVMDETSFGTIGSAVARFINGALEKTDWSQIGKLSINIFTSLLDNIMAFLDTLDWGKVGSAINDFLTGAINSLTDWLNGVDWTEAGEKIRSSLGAFIEGLDTKEIAIAFKNLIATAWNAAVDLLQGALDGSAFATVLTGMKETFDVVSAVIDIIQNPGDITNWANLGLQIQDTIDKLQNGFDLSGLKLPVTPELTPSASEFTSQTQTSLNKNPLTLPFMPTISGSSTSGSTTTTSILNQIRQDYFASTIDLPVTPTLTYNGASGSMASKAFWENTSSTFTTESAKNPAGVTVKYDSVRNELTETQRTVSARAAYNESKNNLSADQRTIPTYSKYAAIKNALTNDQRTISTWSKYVAIRNNLTKDQRTISSWAKFTSAINGLSYTPTINAKAIIQSAQVKDGGVYVGGSIYAYTKAGGGVFKGGKWSPIESFASGGFPRGQMFIAREAGPELVGTLGGHTAVMNNDQIVASVSAGVAKAISSIQFHMTGLGAAATMPTYDEDEDTEEMMYRAFMRAMTNAGLLDSFDINVTAELDGDVVYQNTVRRNRQNTRMTGANALA